VISTKEAEVKTISELIAALEDIQKKHGDLLLANDEGWGGFEVLIELWTETERTEARGTEAELPNVVILESMGISFGK